MISIKYIITFIISFLLINYLKKNSSKIGIVDIPTPRSMHKNPIPSSGGIGFIFSFFISFIIFDFTLFVDNFYLFFAVFLIYLTGLYDDYKDLKPKLKFLMIFIASILLYKNDIFIGSLGSYSGFEVNLLFFALPFTMFAISGFTNALNLIDGLDGLAGGVSIVILATFAHIGSEFNDYLLYSISMTTLVALSAFMLFNWNPAKIFMGDSGSLTLGFIISVVSIMSLKYVHPVTIFYFGAIPIIDTLVVMIRRIKLKKSPFEADKTHIHHILYGFFGNTKQTVKFLIMAQLIFSFLGYVVARHIDMYPRGLFPIAMIVSFAILTKMTYMITTTIIKRKESK